jgi:hypothetical protein
MMGAFGSHFGDSGLGTLKGTQSVVQTAPSKPSGNYYAPSSIDPTASGSYYAQTGAAMYPVASPSSAPKDYWGSMGNPFGNVTNTPSPWGK